MIRITYDPDMPREFRASIEPIVAGLTWLLPAWLKELRIGNSVVGNGVDDGSLATVTVDYEYRQASIQFTAWHLESDTWTRVRTVMHEFIHVSLAPMAVFIAGNIDSICGEDERLAEILKREWRARVESSVQDLANSLMEGVYSGIT